VFIEGLVFIALNCAMKVVDLFRLTYGCGQPVI
jgi:hypothetical protein